MTISTLIRKSVVPGTGVLTAFGFAFQVRSAADLQVYYTDALGVQTLLAANLYTVVLNPIPTGQLWSNGGTVTYPLTGAPIAAGTALTIVRTVSLLQSSSLINQGGYFPDVVEAALDVLTMEMQQVNEGLARALTLPITSTATASLPFPIANALIGWDPTGTFITNVLAAGSIPLPLSVANGGTGSNTAALARTALGVLASGAAAVGAVDLSSASLGFTLINGTLVPSINAGALTIAIKTKAGADPSAADPVLVIFRNSAAATGDYTMLSIVAANSIVIPSTATLGTTNNIPFRFWIVAFNDANTFRLGVVNCLSGTSIMPLRDDILASASNPVANLAQTIYSSAAVATKPMRVVGYLEYSAGLAAVGTYGIVPTKVHNFSVGTTLPGQAVQEPYTQTGAVATGATVLPIDDTIPQNTEGDQYLSLALTPSSPCNILDIDAEIMLAGSAVSGTFGLPLFQDATANALAASFVFSSTAGGALQLRTRHRMLAGTSASTTFKARAGMNNAGTTTVNGFSGGRIFGGVISSNMIVREVMA